MKRSEMLKILEERFSSYESSTNIAQRALSAIEDAGMIPPSFNWIDDGWISAEEAIRETDILEYGHFGWEPEDETL